MLSTKFYR